MQVRKGVMIASKASNTVEVQHAVNKVKNAVQCRIYRPNKTNIPNTFIEKRQYMQSDEFLKDEHNVKMFSILDGLISARDKIAEKIKEYNSQSPKEELVQATNGYARIKKYLDKNTKLNFADFPGATSADAEYKNSKVKAYNQSRSFLKDISR